MSSISPATVRSDFRKAVNMTVGELERWLDTDESRSVGVRKANDPRGSESIGHRSGRRIVSLLRSDVDALDEDDYAHMRKVVGYVERHLAQRPTKASIEDSRWRYSLMNWGHDPLK